MGYRVNTYLNSQNRMLLATDSSFLNNLMSLEITIIRVDDWDLSKDFTVLESVGSYIVVTVNVIREGFCIWKSH